MIRPPLESELAYLESRGYTAALISSEGVQVIENEKATIHGVEVQATTPRVMWTARAMSGQVIGLQTRELLEHKYRWYQAPKAQHLPIIYATEEDHELLYRTGEMLIVEGAFDRIVVKRCFPELAVYARLSKGAANQLAHFIRRYVTRLWTLFDMDDRGEKANQQTEERFSTHLQVNGIKIPFKDPSQLFEKRGLGRTREILSKQMEAVL
jgi:5S rRNA maturation endonuclease (ribonuclease M5)